MSDLDEKEPEMKELINKMSRYNKNTKALMELIGRVSEKLDKVLDWNGGVKNDNDEKERVGKIFRKERSGQTCKKLGQQKGTILENAKRR